ncbi:hypothetical protein A9Q79_10290 [Methylophaga sp. 42_25_T18]|nr:hypothetical protein A9Q79_10290 [Methylophaga sp. 42_25_T18]
MKKNEGTFDSARSKDATLDQIISIFRCLGATNLYVKSLAPNDNSKNQLYFGSHLTDLPFIPTSDLIPSASKSNKGVDPKRKIKYQTAVNLFWVDVKGETYKAPNAKLIYYPQYPEVRFSGFLQGSEVNVSGWMDRYKQGTTMGRWLILGVTQNKEVYSYLVTPECALSKELEVTDLIEISSVFRQIDIEHTGITDTRAALLEKLLEIHEMGWVAGQRLQSDKTIIPYNALNGGGYTLESLLGIPPNSDAEPDYLGWEVKQFGVSKFPRTRARPTTLMTPEPNGGFYKLHGVPDFVRSFGYPDMNGVPDRLNFGGVHRAGQLCKKTSLTMYINGFDAEESKITDAEGVITLTDNKGTVAASWSFAKVMDHWKRKHSQAVYVPCIMRPIPGGGRSYHYGTNVELGKGTDFEMFLSAMFKGMVYYDPGIKLENASSEKAKLKTRNQFRVNHRNIGSLYRNLDFVDIASTK